MKDSSQQTELFRSGLIEEQASPKEISEWKEARRKAYTKEYNKRYSEKRKKVNLVFEKEIYVRWVEKSKEHGMPLATYLKSCIQNYHEGIYISPKGKELNAISKLLLEINNSISRSIALVPLSQGMSYEDIASLKRRVADIEFLVEQSLQPKSLTVFIKEGADNSPSFIPKLLNAISQYLTKQPC